MPYVEYDLSDFTDRELIDEIASRDIDEFPIPKELTEELTSIYELRRLGKDYDHLVEKLIRKYIGKVL